MIIIFPSINRFCTTQREPYCPPVSSSQNNADTIPENITNNLPSSKSSITSKPGSKVSRTGYRVQIGAFEDKDRADKMKTSALSKIDLPVYVEYLTPFFRVRVGDFTEKSEAEECVKFLKEMGFKEALWVYTNINTQ